MPDINASPTKTHADMPHPEPRLRDKFRWTRSSSFILSLMLLIIGLVVIVWWPLVEDYSHYINPDYPIWIQIDWLLIGIFFVMSILVTIGADIRRDAMLVLVSFIGGFVIESWGTHTGLWAYYTGEKPPLWILPAWPIATLAIERLVRILEIVFHGIPDRWIKGIYILVFTGFTLYMLVFVYPSIQMPYTIMAVIGVILVSILPGNRRVALVTFVAGTALGIFLEYWGTTRECWTYYTFQKPPLFAIFAHGLASVAFWRVTKLAETILQRILITIKANLRNPKTASRISEQ